MRWQTIKETSDAGQLIDVVDWSKQNIFFIWHATARGFGLLGECRHEILIDTSRTQHSCRCRAILPRIEVTSHRDTFGGGSYIGVIKDNDWRFATQFKMDSLETFRRRLSDFHSSAH